MMESTGQSFSPILLYVESSPGSSDSPSPLPARAAMSSAVVACAVARGPSAAALPGEDSPPAGFKGIYIASDSDDDSGGDTSGESTLVRARRLD